MTTSKTGKHGHAKAHIVCTDIFTGKKYEINEPTSHNLTAPRVTKEEYDLIDLGENGEVTYLDKEGNYNEELTIDTTSDLYENMKKDLENDASLLISVCSALN